VKAAYKDALWFFFVIPLSLSTKLNKNFDPLDTRLSLKHYCSNSFMELTGVLNALCSWSAHHKPFMSILFILIKGVMCRNIITHTMGSQELASSPQLGKS
jgi:hypothetical protein